MKYIVAVRKGGRWVPAIRREHRRIVFYPQTASYPDRRTSWLQPDGNLGRDNKEKYKTAREAIGVLKRHFPKVRKCNKRAPASKEGDIVFELME